MSLLMEPTARLSFEPLAVAHAAELSGLTHPDVIRFIGGEPKDVARQRQDFVRKAQGPKDPSRQIWVNILVRTRLDGRAIGRLEATVVPAPPAHAEIAFVFVPQSWGQGLAFDAMQAFLPALAGAFDIFAFWATAHPENQRSQNLLARLGLIPALEGEWPDLFSYDPGDIVMTRPA